MTAQPLIDRPALHGRLYGLDAARGLAVVVMILDHVLVVAGAADSPLRYTVTRLALPLFMLLAGSLVSTHVRWRRLLRVAVAGLSLPLFVPWIDDPNVLVLYVLGVLVVAVARQYGRTGLGLALVLVLTATANGWGDQGPGYAWAGVIGLMVAGAYVGRHRLDDLFGGQAPGLTRRFRVLGAVGRYPLAVYVGHIVVLELLRRVLL